MSLSPLTVNDTPPAFARNNLQQLVLFRVVAISGQIVTVSIVGGILEIPLPIVLLAGGIGFLILFNIATVLRLRNPGPVSDRELMVQILVDVAVLTAQLYFTGGATNPFVNMYVFPIAIAAAAL